MQIKIYDKLKDKRIIAVIIALLLIIVIAIVLLTNGNSKATFQLLDTEFKIEYGDVISTDPKDYLKNDEDFLEKVTVETDAVNESIITKDDNDEEVIIEKDYPAVGEYEVNLTYESETETVKVIVQDTTAPEFLEWNETLEFNIGNQPENYFSLFSVEDLGEVTITIDDSQVDFDKVGEYKAIVTATDNSGNETVKNITFKIVEEGAENKEVSQSMSTVIEKSSNTKTSGTSSSASTSKSNSSSSGSAASRGSSSSSSSDLKSSSGSSGSSSSSSSGAASSNSGSTSSTAGSAGSSSGTSTSSSVTASSGSTSNSSGNSSESSSSSGTSSSSAETETWAMTLDEMISYAKKCVANLGFTWSEEATKENSGWFAPLTIKISYTEEEIKTTIKGSVDTTCELLNTDQYGIKVYFEKVDNTYKVYCLY